MAHGRKITSVVVVLASNRSWSVVQNALDSLIGDAHLTKLRGKGAPQIVCIERGAYAALLEV
jgi:hypothetical protein